MDAYLKPVGNFEIDLVDALHPIVEGLNRLTRLQMGLLEPRKTSQQSASQERFNCPVARVESRQGGRLGKASRRLVGRAALTSMAG